MKTFITILALGSACLLSGCIAMDDEDDDHVRTSTTTTEESTVVRHPVNTTTQTRTLSTY